MFSHPLGDGAELRPFEPHQAAELTAYLERNRPQLAPWLPWATTITDLESARAFLQRYADGQATDTRRIYALWQDDELVGGLIFRVFDTATGSCELGAWLSSGAEGRGLMTRACRALIDWAFDVRGMRRVVWQTVPHNKRSIAVAERLRMHREGVLRQSFPFLGELLDVEVWSLLPDERQPNERPTTQSKR